MILSDEIKKLLKSAENIAIIQAENPDGDSFWPTFTIGGVFRDAWQAVFRYIAQLKSPNICAILAAGTEWIPSSTHDTQIYILLSIQRAKSYYQKYSKTQIIARHYTTNRLS